MLEVIEHLEDWQSVFKKIKKNLNKNGTLIISTINKTFFSKFFAIFLAEQILEWVPKNTHNFNKFVRPDELKNILIENNFSIENITGMNYNIVSRQWDLSKTIHPINYFCTAKLI